ncbi:MAG: hypothetical protein J0L92_33135 [Deltaproteobacteria bacterium]|nr:hypothetical protein [Deltaproteobacteria bacterium]
MAWGLAMQLVASTVARADDDERPAPAAQADADEPADAASSNDGSWADSPDLLVPVSRPAPVVLVVPPARERVASLAMVSTGAGIAFGSLLLGGFSALVATFVSYLDGTRVPRIDGVGGREMAYFVSFTPVVGSGIWSAMILESPPQSGVWPIVFGIVSLLGQQAGIALVMAGSFGSARITTRPRIDSWVSNDGAGLGVRGVF